MEKLREKIATSRMETYDEQPNPVCGSSHGAVRVLALSVDQEDQRERELGEVHEPVLESG